MNAPSLFAGTQLMPPDSNIGLTEEFRRDPRPQKLNLSVGTYLDETGHIPVMSAIRKAEAQRACLTLPRDYQPIEGGRAFATAAQSLLFEANESRLLDGHVATVQALGGTGALRLAAAYLRRILPGSTAYTSLQTWDNHRQIFGEVGFKVADYPYYDHDAKRVDFDAMVAFLNQVPSESIIILHACCHNPSGADLSQAQWRELAIVLQAKRLVPLLDVAYQGFGEGVSQDVFPVRLLADLGMSFLVAHSFSKTFSFYGERVGALSIVADSAEEAGKVMSNLKQIVRTMYSNPPTHGGAVVASVLGDQALRKEWEDELTQMRSRIQQMRAAFVSALEGHGLDYRFVLNQRGMFSFAALSVEQVSFLKSEFGIYALKSGRICLAALNDANVDYVTRAIYSALTL